jgi:hypothetical protein
MKTLAVFRIPILRSNVPYTKVYGTPNEGNHLIETGFNEGSGTRPGPLPIGREGQYSPDIILFQVWKSARICSEFIPASIDSSWGPPGKGLGTSLEGALSLSVG